VIARPGQESADLGAVLHAFRRTGARLGLLCLTRGEASPLNSTCQRLEAIRPWELQAAAGILGLSSVMVADFPDGRLGRSSLAALTERVQRAIAGQLPDLLLVIDPATGSPGDAQVAKAVCRAARSAGLPVAARTLAYGRERLRWLIRPAGSGKVPLHRILRLQHARIERAAGQAR
jgi:LmbE family N-acetylglucosaminyl deacetylase